MTWASHVPVYQPTGSQFVNNLRGGCTLLALAACDIVSKGMGAWVGDPHVVNPNPASVANLQAVMWRIYQDALASGNCAENGAANQAQMIRQANRIGLPIHDILYYREPLPYALWLDFLHQHIGAATPPRPILVQLANGRALYDATSGKQDEADLAYHAIALYGTETEPQSPASGGYVGCDGDNPISNEHPVIYSRPTLIAAQPISMIAFDYVHTMCGGK